MNYSTIRNTLMCAVGVVLCSCATTSYEWSKKGGTTEERDRYLAEAEVMAIQAYPDPISHDQINSEPINAPTIRLIKKNRVIINHMASKGWSLTPKPESNN